MSEDKKPKTFLFKTGTNQKPASPTIQKEHVVLSETGPVKIETTVSPIENKVEKGRQEKLVEYNQKTGIYTGIAVDSQEDGLLQAIGLMEGTPYIVEYYQQYLGRDDETAAFSRHRPIPLQQYRRIKRFEIRVSSPWSYNHDKENQEDELTGSGYIYPVLRPNKGDMFIADIGDGRSGLIEIDSVERLSHRKYTAYKIDYHVREYLTKETHQMLIDKSIDTYYFDKQRMLGYGNPFLAEDELDGLIDLEKTLFRLKESYFKWFYDPETSAWRVPTGDSHRIYDIFHARFVDAIIDKKYHPSYRSIRFYLPEHENQRKITTIWDALLWREWMLIDDATTKFAVLPSYMMQGSRWQWNGYHSRFDGFIYDSLFTEGTHTLMTVPVFSAPAQLPVYIEEDTSVNRRYIYPIGANGDYVFSHYFYEEDKEKMSRLEYQVYQYLHEDCIDRVEILRLLKAAQRWDDLDKFYYLPILFFLGQQLLAGVYDNER